MFLNNIVLKLDTTIAASFIDLNILDKRKETFVSGK